MIENLSIALRASIIAGNEIMGIYTNPDSDFQIERKADNSPLTIADKNANERIVALLARTELPVLSEEGRMIPFEERKAWDKLWIVDPLDGTKEFIKQNGEFTVNIALVEKGTPVLGVIYVPAE
ncbi:MAG: 3'(2'),5'-bisphosphate nucleotidase CysQ family protein, partial [Bacteroidales bacterium]